MATDQEALLLQIAYDLNKIQKQQDQAFGIVNTGAAKMVARSKEAAAAIESSFGTVTLGSFKASLAETATLQDRLTAAYAAGDAVETKALSKQLALQAQLQKAAIVQLETQLAIAKAAGSTKQIAELQELLAVSREVQRLSAVGLIGTKGLAEAEKSILAVTAAERAAEKAGVGLAATRVFDSARLATLEEGGTRLRLFGSALEPLGAYGIAAAAGVIALAVAGEEARKAMEWADTLEKTSQKLGTSTDALQKFDYAAVASSIGLERGRETLETFNVAIGKFETHTGDTRLKKWADAIKLDRDQVNATVDPIEKLSLVMERIATLSDAQSRAGAAKAFGLDGLLPIINGGKEAIGGFIAKMKEAQGVGGVVSAADIAKAAEMNEKVEALSFLIGQHLKEAFLSAAPAIEKVAEFIERATHALAGFLSEIPDAIRGLDDLISKIPHLPQGIHVDVGQAAEGVARAAGLGPGIDAAHAARSGFEALAERGRAAKLAGGIADLMAGKPVDFTGTELGASKNQRAGQQLTFDKAKKGPADQTDSLTKTAEEDQQHALKALAEAYKNLTANVDARAKFEIDANNAEAAAEQIKLAADLKKLLKDKTIDGKTSDILQAKIEEASANVELARVAKNDLVARNQRFADEARDDETRKELADAAILQLELALNLATTQAERNRIEREILTLKQQEALHLKATQLSNLEATGAITDEEGGKRFAAFLGAQKTERQQQVVAQEDPVQRYIKSVQDLNTVMKTAAVTAAHDLSVGLADAIVNAKNLGDVASSVFKQLIAQLLAAAIQKDIAAPFLAVLGLADGGRVNGPGTSTSDSIPAMLSDGEYVVNAAAASKHGRLLEAINSGQIPRFAMGGPVPSLGPSFDALHTVSLPARSGGAVIVQQFHLHAEGALMTNEYTAKLQQQARAEANTAAAAALRTANKTFPARQRAFGLLGTT